MSSFADLLLGRRTYDDFHRFWPKQKDNPFTEVLDNSLKYMASTTLHEPLPSMNSSSSPETPRRPCANSEAARKDLRDPRQRQAGQP